MYLRYTQICCARAPRDGAGAAGVSGVAWVGSKDPLAGEALVVFNIYIGLRQHYLAPILRGVHRDHTASALKTYSDEHHRAVVRGCQPELSPNF